MELEYLSYENEEGKAYGNELTLIAEDDDEMAFLRYLYGWYETYQSDGFTRFELILHKPAHTGNSSKSRVIPLKMRFSKPDVK